MAATKSVYSKSAMMESQLVNNAASNNKLFFYALCLSAYENDANVKNIFHLDYLSHFTDTDGKSCFFGCVKVGGANAAYHAAKRLSKVKTRIENNECVILNDAGLNTTPHAELVEVKYAYLNYLVITFKVKKAYYFNEVTPYIRPYITTKNNQQASDFSIVNFTTDGSLCTLIVTSLDSYINVQDILKLEIRASNSEGTFINPTTLLTAQLKCKIRVVTLLKVTNISATTGTTYVCVLTENQFHAVAGSSYTNGNNSYVDSVDKLLDAFFVATGTDVENATGWPSAVTINGAETASLTDACFTSFLPDGMYKGMPETFNGEVSTKAITIHTYTAGQIGLVSRWDLEPVVVSLSVTTSGSQTLNELQEILTLVAGVSYTESGGSVGTITFTLRLQKQRLHDSTWSDEMITHTTESGTVTGYVEVTTTGNNVTKTLTGYSGGLNIRRWSVVDISYTSINTANIASETDNNLE
jgi:hypothetical protein